MQATTPQHIMSNRRKSFSSLGVTIRLNGNRFSNGDIVEGTAAVDVRKSVGVDKIEVQCICERRLRLLQYAGGAPSSLVMSTQMGPFQPNGINASVHEDVMCYKADRVVFPDWEAAESKGMTLAEGEHTFPFSFVLPDEDLSVPESLEIEDVHSGHYWYIAVIVKRTSSLSPNGRETAPFLFVPRRPPVYVSDPENRTQTVGIVPFKAYSAPPDNKLLSRFSSKNRSKVDLEIVLDAPAEGIARTGKPGFNLTISSSAPGLVTLKSMRVDVKDQLVIKAYVHGIPCQEVTPEHGYKIAEIEPNRVLGKSTSFEDICDHIEIPWEICGAFENQNFEYLHLIQIMLLMVSTENPSHYQRFTARLVTRLLPRPASTHSFEDGHHDALPPYVVEPAPAPYSSDWEVPATSS